MSPDSAFTQCAIATRTNLVDDFPTCAPLPANRFVAHAFRAISQAALLIALRRSIRPACLLVLQHETV